MRAYHFLSATHALDDVRSRRLKIATFDDLNDPFELWAVAQSDAVLRRGLRGWKREIAKKYGMLCFSDDWHNPVLWSHYADKHRGMVVGFDINSKIIRNVQYVDHRPTFQNVNETTLFTLLYTKHRDWQYEREWRIFTQLERRDSANGLYFGDFNQDLVLREVIVGALCTTSKHAIKEALRDNDVVISKGRLAFNTFRIVKDRRGFRATK
jgi:hypothetical protein